MDDLVTLGARGHLPGGHIEDTLRFLKQCVHKLPRGYMLDSFEMYPHFDHNVTCDHMLVTFEMSPQNTPWGHFE